jgi:hypothetical protein
MVPFFTIRNAQLEAFDAAADGQLAARLLAALRQHHASALGSRTDADLQRQIERGLSRARRLGIEHDENRTAFVVLEFEVGLGFEAYPPITKRLRHPEGTADENFEHLLQLTFDDEWDAAKGWLALRSAGSSAG